MACKSAEETFDVDAEVRLFNRCCPYYGDGSRRGLEKYIESVCRRSGLSLESVSYAWRTTHTMREFLTALGLSGLSE